MEIRFKGIEKSFYGLQETIYEIEEESFKQVKQLGLKEKYWKLFRVERKDNSLPASLADIIVYIFFGLKHLVIYPEIIEYEAIIYPKGMTYRVDYLTLEDKERIYKFRFLEELDDAPRPGFEPGSQA